MPEIVSGGGSSSGAGGSVDVLNFPALQDVALYDSGGHPLLIRTADNGTDRALAIVGTGDTKQLALSSDISATQNRAITNWPATQPVSGTVAVSNLPVTQPVSGTVTANQGAAGVALWKVDGSGVVQPVSGTVAVSNFPATQPVSGTVTSNDGGAAGTADSGAGSFAQPTTGTGITGYLSGIYKNIKAAAASLAGTLTVSGTVTSNQGGAPWSQNLTQVLGAALSATNPVFVETVAGGATINTGQKSVASTATQIVAANSARRRITITNQGSAAVWIGAAGVSTLSGYELPTTAGVNILTLYTTAAIFGIVSSTSVVVTYIEEAT